MIMLSKAFWKVCKNGASKAHEIETIGCQQIKTYTPCTCNFNVSWPKNFPLCCNPSFGLATKARACKGEGQEGSPGVTSHAPGSVEECEGMNPTLPNELPLWELESRWTFKSSKSDYRGQNPLDWNVLYIIEKLLEFRCLKWARMTHLDNSNTSYGQKKGRESNWQFDSWPLKVGNRPNFLECRWCST